MLSGQNKKISNNYFYYYCYNDYNNYVHYDNDNTHIIQYYTISYLIITTGIDDDEDTLVLIPYDENCSVAQRIATAQADGRDDYYIAMYSTTSPTINSKSGGNRSSSGGSSGGDRNGEASHYILTSKQLI